jgi:hypothetical protein
MTRLEPMPGRGWHTLRRKFANDLRDAPLRDLADLGWWKSPLTIVKVYQQPDVDAERALLRKRNAGCHSAA